MERNKLFHSPAGVSNHLKRITLLINLNFLALKWAVTEKYHDYLYGATFEVITDNNPLTYVFTTAKLDATGQRWLAALSNYFFFVCLILFDLILYVHSTIFQLCGTVLPGFNQY